MNQQRIGVFSLLGQLAMAEGLLMRCAQSVLNRQPVHKKGGSRYSQAVNSVREDTSM